MPTEKFSDFTLKSTPLSGDFLVGYDGTAEIRTTINNVLNTLLPSIISAVGSVPVGTIITHAASTAPTGNWLPCDGRSLSTAGLYANLYSIIGTTYGSGTGTFNVPDLRGYFVRGWENTIRGADLIDGSYAQVGTLVTITTNTPHGLTTGNVVAVTYSSGTGVSGSFTVLATGLTSTVFKYTAAASQTASGNVVLTGRSHLFGQTENDGIGSHTHIATDSGHTHSYTRPNTGTTYAGSYSGGGVTGVSSSIATGSGNANITIASAGTASETRPKNIALLYCIKY